MEILLENIDLTQYLKIRELTLVFLKHSDLEWQHFWVHNSSTLFYLLDSFMICSGIQTVLYSWTLREQRQDEKDEVKVWLKKRRGEVEEKEREEEDNEVECEGWGSSGMLAFHHVCVCVCEWVRHAQLLHLSITNPQTALKLTAAALFLFDSLTCHFPTSSTSSCNRTHKHFDGYESVSWFFYTIIILTNHILSMYR